MLTYVSMSDFRDQGAQEVFTKCNLNNILKGTIEKLFY